MNQSKNALTLDSKMFNALKSDFNQLLRATLSSMIQKEGEKAKMSMTLNITLTEGYAPDLQEVRYEAERKIIIPKFEHKIVATMQYKDEKSGYLGGEEYELFWDKESCNYIMRRIKDAQISLFDAEDSPDLDISGDDAALDAGLENVLEEPLEALDADVVQEANPADGDYPYVEAEKA